jgi:hypothetical protein
MHRIYTDKRIRDTQIHGLTILIIGLIITILGYLYLGVDNLVQFLAIICAIPILLVISTRYFNYSIVFLFLISITIPIIARFFSPKLLSALSVFKLGTLVSAAIGWWLYFSHRPVKVNKWMWAFIFALSVSLGIFVLRAISDLTNGTNISEVALFFQRFSLAYAFLPIIVYYQTKNVNWHIGLLKLLFYTGMLLAIIGIIQWIVGPDWLQKIGMNLSIGMEEFHFTVDPRTGRQFFRVFSTLSSHYDLAGFMDLTIPVALALYWIKKIRLTTFILSVACMAIALLATFNNTGWFVLLVTLALAVWQVNRISNRSIRISKKKMNLIIAGTFILFLAFVFLSTAFRERIASSLTFGRYSPSLSSRLTFLENSVDALKMKPWGWGFNLGQLQALSVSMDLFLIYVLVVGGGFFFFFYALLYALPVWFGWKSIKQVASSNKELFIFYVIMWSWIASGALIGTLSNAQVTNSSPSNLLFWSAIGLIFKIPDLTTKT